MGKPDLSELDRIPEDVVERLPPWWRKVYAALRELRNEREG